MWNYYDSVKSIEFIDVANVVVGKFRDRSVYEIGLIVIRGVSPLFCEALEMDSEGRIIEVVLGTEFSDYDRRMFDNKTRPKNWCSQFAQNVGPSANSVRYSNRLVGYYKRAYCSGSTNIVGAYTFWCRNTKSQFYLNGVQLSFKICILNIYRVATI